MSLGDKLATQHVRWIMKSLYYIFYKRIVKNLCYVFYKKDYEKFMLYGICTLTIKKKKRKGNASIYVDNEHEELELCHIFVLWNV